jgi:hypothetical protein
MKYHYPCGRENGAVYIVSGDMKTFCARHEPKNKAKLKVKDNTCLAGCWDKIKNNER